MVWIYNIIYAGNEIILFTKQSNKYEKKEKLQKSLLLKWYPTSGWIYKLVCGVKEKIFMIFVKDGEEDFIHKGLLQ